MNEQCKKSGVFSLKDYSHLSTHMFTRHYYFTFISSDALKLSTLGVKTKFFRAMEWELNRKEWKFPLHLSTHFQHKYGKSIGHITVTPSVVELVKIELYHFCSLLFVTVIISLLFRVLEIYTLACGQEIRKPFSPPHFQTSLLIPKLSY